MSAVCAPDLPLRLSHRTTNLYIYLLSLSHPVFSFAHHHEPKTIRQEATTWYSSTAVIPLSPTRKEHKHIKKYEVHCHSSRHGMDRPPGNAPLGAWWQLARPIVIRRRRGYQEGKDILDRCHCCICPPSRRSLVIEGRLSD